MAKETIISPLMIVRYAYLVNPSTTYKKDGEFSVKAALEDGTPETEEFKEKLLAVLEGLLPKATADLKPAQKNKLTVVNPWAAEEDSETGEETGFITMNFACPAKVTRKSDGKVFNFSVALFDSTGAPIEDRSSVQIGSGSQIQVSFTADRAYCMESKGPDNKPFFKAGLGTDLKAVMIHSLKTGSASAGSYGFTPSGDGFQYEKPESAGNPFQDQEVPPPTDGDF